MGYYIDLKMCGRCIGELPSVLAISDKREGFREQVVEFHLAVSGG